MSISRCLVSRLCMALRSPLPSSTVLYRPLPSSTVLYRLFHLSFPNHDLHHHVYDLLTGAVDGLLQPDGITRDPGALPLLDRTFELRQSFAQFLQMLFPDADAHDFLPA